MNILFLSRLSDNNNCGPYYSIPRQVAAQREFDNVFWLNANKNYFDDWAEIGDVKTEKDYPAPRLCDLPIPFNHPDIVVVEEQYNFVRMPLMVDVQKSKIPYIIVPRCSLTASALKKKRFKKMLANLVYFSSFMKKAAGIQYLTEQEKEESGERWNANGIVIPNGITVPDVVKEYHSDKIEATFIGRIDVYHKGLDLLLAACAKIIDEMKKAHMHISIYGAGVQEDVDSVKSAIQRCSGVVDYLGPVHGSEKEKVLLDSDVFLLTSRFEGMPMGLLEAMSYGIPVIITKGTNMIPVVEKYGCGWYDEISEAGIIRMLRTMIKERDLIPEKGKRGINAAHAYDWSNIARQTHQVLVDIVGKG